MVGVGSSSSSDNSVGVNVTSMSSVTTIVSVKPIVSVSPVVSVRLAVGVGGKRANCVGDNVDVGGISLVGTGVVSLSWEQVWVYLRGRIRKRLGFPCPLPPD